MYSDRNYDHFCIQHLILRPYTIMQVYYIRIALEKSMKYTHHIPYCIVLYD